MNLGIIISIVSLLTGYKPSALSDILKITIPEIIVRAGESSIIKIEVEIKKGYHIQANKVNDDLLIPTTLEISEEKNITTGRQEFPPAKKFKLEETNIFLDVYDEVFEIKIPVTTTKKIPKGKHTLKAKLRYQACDHKTCLFPKTIDFSFTIKVVASFRGITQVSSCIRPSVIIYPMLKE